MAEEELTDEERLQILSRISALAALIEKYSSEMRGLTLALATKKPRSKKETDQFGEPTFNFERKVAIPNDIKLTRRMRDYALEKGFNATQIAPMWENFTNYYRRTGTKWKDWYAVWQKWVRTDIDRRKSQPSTSRDLEELK